jgi:hypothetical protein
VFADVAEEKHEEERGRESRDKEQDHADNQCPNHPSLAF